MSTKSRMNIALARVFWRIFVPTGTTLLAVRFLLPSPSAARLDNWAGAVARRLDTLDVPVAVFVFLATTWLVVYWRKYLPGGNVLEPQVQAAKPFKNLKLLAMTVAVVGVGLFVRTRVVESHQVVSTSMVPTLLPDDRILTDKSAFAPLLWPKSSAAPALPKRGEVVVFSAKGRTNEMNHLVKRVIGLPGDRISIHMGSISINDWKVPSCNAGSFVHAVSGQLIVGRIAVEFLGAETYLAIKVPEDSFATNYTVLPNEVFVMGDNRGFSEDSRVWVHTRVGGVPLDALEGRVRKLVLSRSQLLAPLGTDLPFTHVDLKALQSGLDTCLKQRPEVTLPPPVSPAA